VGDDTRLRGLDLFSGIGGIALALEPYVTTKAYCECEPFAQAVLLSRMSEAKIETAPIWDDVRTLNKKILEAVGEIDIISGGFPCQDISVAGLGRGLEAERSGLFFEIVRLTKEIRPPFVFLENVPNIRTKGLSEVIKSFTEIRYDVRWACFTASSFGAPHRRERWFALAHTRSERRQQKSRGAHGNEIKNEGRAKKKMHEFECHGEGHRTRAISYTLRERLQRQRQKPSGIKEKFYNIGDDSWWEIEPSLGRVVNGLPDRTHRIKALGNAVVPFQARKAFEKLIGLSVNS
jgi:DNA (cytosine-5)-methyltransferase 1